MDSSFNNLSLCSGGGGLDLGLELALERVSTVCWVEWEAFAIDYLATCMESNCLAPAPIWTDLRTFDGKPWRGVVDTLTAGYPCQPFSEAGKRRGADDPRHLWPHVARVVGEVKPRIIFLENVPGHLSLGYDQVESDLQGLGYQVTPGLFTAQEVGAPQLRERLYILAVANTYRLAGRREVPERCPQRRTPTAWSGCTLGAFPPGPDGVWRGVPTYRLPACEPGVCSLADGLAADRSRWKTLLGNGVVPLQAAYAFLSLWAVNSEQ